jgi:hypothetical protein
VSTSAALATRKASQRARAAAEIRALPSIDLGPVERPPCKRQRHALRFVLIAVALHRWLAMGRRCRPSEPRKAREKASIFHAPQMCLGMSGVTI